MAFIAVQRPMTVPLWEVSWHRHVALSSPCYDDPNPNPHPIV